VNTTACAPDIHALGDSALLLVFGDVIDESVNERVLACASLLRAQAWPGIRDIVPAYASVTLHYDPALWCVEQLATRLARLPLQPERGCASRNTIELPVCYEADFAPDIEAVAAHAGLAVDELVRRHCAVQYRVYFIGFTPGFPYLGGLDPALQMPRRATPRLQVAAGSVAIGGNQTGIYPQQSPGGWHIIGRTPSLLFDAARQPPCLLQPGDCLRFVAISAQQFRRLREAAA
jgi:KipI family sensor histidine kinase inhibitor